MRTDSEIFIARAEHSTASAAVLDLHACAGVATDAVPAPATRSGVSAAATLAPGWPGPERPRPSRPRHACVGVAGAAGAPTSAGMAGNPTLVEPASRPHWGRWPRPRREEEGGAGGGVEWPGRARLRRAVSGGSLLYTMGKSREYSLLYGSTSEPTRNRTDQIT